jgi:serine/threonine protein kinase
MPVPTQIGRYQIETRLGAGGFAVVWLAHDESLDTKVAIKVLADNWAGEPELRARFLAEARMLRRAASSRVVQVFDIGELDDGRPYFVMQHADRGTLSNRVKQSGRLPLVEALRLTAEVAQGVADLHRAGIVHRDLKPSNVLITTGPDGREHLLVADLGVAKSMAGGSNLTMSVGSIGYMAPEQAVPSKGVDVRADVYSLGAMAANLITGNSPGLAGFTEPWLQAQPELPEPVRELLAQALQPKAEDRWPDAASFSVRLKELARQFSAPAPVVAPAAAVVSPLAVPGLGAQPAAGLVEAYRSTRDVRRRSMLILSAGFTVVVLAAAGFIFLHHLNAADAAGGSAHSPLPSATGTATPGATGTGKDSPKPTAAPKKDPLAGGSLKPEGEWNYAILSKVTPTGITFDLIDYFTGDAAIQACAQDGVAVAVADWCHDYYWRNKSSRLRTMTLNPNADVHYYQDGGQVQLDPKAITKLNSLDKAGKTGGGDSIFKLTEHNDSIDQLEEILEK